MNCKRRRPRGSDQWGEAIPSLYTWTLIMVDQFPKKGAGRQSLGMSKGRQMSYFTFHHRLGVIWMTMQRWSKSTWSLIVSKFVGDAILKSMSTIIHRSQQSVKFCLMDPNVLGRCQTRLLMLKHSWFQIQKVRMNNFTEHLWPKWRTNSTAACSVITILRRITVHSCPKTSW